MRRRKRTNANRKVVRRNEMGRYTLEGMDEMCLKLGDMLERAIAGVGDA